MAARGPAPTNLKVEVVQVVHLAVGICADSGMVSEGVSRG